MRRSEHLVPLAVDDLPFLLCVATPEQEHEMLALGTERADDRIGKALPATALMGSRLAAFDRQHAVEQKDALLRPGFQISTSSRRQRRRPPGFWQDIGRLPLCILGIDLLVHVHERRRRRQTFGHREAQAVRLARPVVGVLTEDDDLDRFERRQRKGVEPEARVWIDDRAARLALGEVGAQFPHVIRREFGIEQWFPARVDDNGLAFCRLGHAVFSCGLAHGTASRVERRGNPDYPWQCNFLGRNPIIKELPFVAAVLLVAMLPAARALGASCPVAAPFEYTRAPANLAPDVVIKDDAPINATADRVVSEDGIVTLEGDSRIEYQGRQLEAENATYDPLSGVVRIDGELSFLGTGIRLQSEGARIDLDDDRFSTGKSTYEIDVGGRRAAGSAESMSHTDDGRFTLEGATYSSCPPGDESWFIRAREINLDRESGIGSAKGIVLNFKGVPVLAVPAFSFPIGPQRKTGFLAPSIGRSDNVGFEFSVPWYWNIRPNLDATFTPRLTTRRGPILQSELRYLNAQGRWTVENEFLRDRARDGLRRSFTRLSHDGRFDATTTSRIEASTVSDSNYFEDLGNSLEAASITHLEQRADLEFENPEVTGRVRLQGFQTVDPDIIAADRPYRRLPQVMLSARRTLPFGLRARLDGEMVYFDRSDSVTGPRLDVQPRLSLPLAGDAWFLRPTLTHRFTYYRLNNLGDADDPTSRSISRNINTFAIDSGLFFDRVLGDSGTIQTLEPRVYYLKVPYADQRFVPIFDSAAFDFNISQLFRENRFSGADRIADANQVSLGLTSRFIDGATGREPLRLSIGQIFYLDDRRVTLDRVDGATTNEGRRDTSDFVGEVAAGIADDWYASGSLQWNPDDDTTVRGSLLLSYRPEDGRLANIAHRVVNTGTSAETEQIDLSVLWPVGKDWRLAGRWNYSLDQDVSIESLIGVEYDSCCWGLRLAARRYISDDGLDHDASVYVQLVLKGLAPLGQNYGSLLESSVLGYRDEIE